MAADNIHVAVLCPGFVQTRIHESHRNRPARYAEEPAAGGAAGGLAEQIKEFVESGMPVERVGPRVVEALRDNELYIFTHVDGFREAVQQRFDAIDAAFERAAKSQVLS